MKNERFLVAGIQGTVPKLDVTKVSKFERLCYD